MMKFANLWNPNMLRMAGTLDGHIRMAGGAVRDAVANKPINDFDFCTPFSPEEVQNRLIKIHDVSIIPTGIEHGTITAFFKNDKEQFEITTLRRDVTTDGRRATVEYISDWKLDAARRDFTINAMMIDPNGFLYDWFGGESDLAAGIIRFVGNADDRIKEDYLRIMRWFRFWVRYGSNTQMNHETLKAIKRNVKGLQDISRERIWSEMKKIIMSDNTEEVLGIMRKTGVLKYGSIEE